MKKAIVKRSVCALLMAAVLIGTVPVSAAPDSEIIGLVRDMSDPVRGYSAEMFRMLLNLYDACSETEKPHIVSLLHEHFVMYQTAGFMAETVYGYEKGMPGAATGMAHVYLEKWELAKYEDYIYGRIGADEYVEEIRGVFEAGEGGEDSAKKELGK